MNRRQMTMSCTDRFLEKISAPWGHYYDSQGRIHPLSFDQWWGLQLRTRNGFSTRGVVDGLDASNPQFVLA